jgi:hypothetical protein
LSVGKSIDDGEMSHLNRCPSNVKYSRHNQVVGSLSRCVDVITRPKEWRVSENSQKGNVNKRKSKIIPKVALSSWTV